MADIFDFSDYGNDMHNKPMLPPGPKKTEEILHFNEKPVQVFSRERVLDPFRKVRRKWTYRQLPSNLLPTDNALDKNKFASNMQPKRASTATLSTLNYEKILSSDFDTTAKKGYSFPHESRRCVTADATNIDEFSNKRFSVGTIQPKWSRPKFSQNNNQNIRNRSTSPNNFPPSSSSSKRLNTTETITTAALSGTEAPNTDELSYDELIKQIQKNLQIETIITSANTSRENTPALNSKHNCNKDNDVIPPRLNQIPELPSTTSFNEEIEDTNKKRSNSFQKKILQNFTDEFEDSSLTGPVTSTKLNDINTGLAPEHNPSSESKHDHYDVNMITANEINVIAPIQTSNTESHTKAPINTLDLEIDLSSSTNNHNNPNNDNHNNSFVTTPTNTKVNNNKIDKSRGGSFKAYTPHQSRKIPPQNKVILLPTSKSVPLHLAEVMPISQPQSKQKKQMKQPRLNTISMSDSVMEDIEFSTPNKLQQQNNIHENNPFDNNDYSSNHSQGNFYIDLEHEAEPEPEPDYNPMKHTSKSIPWKQDYLSKTLLSTNPQYNSTIRSMTRKLKENNFNKSYQPSFQLLQSQTEFATRASTANTLILNRHNNFDFPLKTSKSTPYLSPYHTLNYLKHQKQNNKEIEIMSVNRPYTSIINKRTVDDQIFKDRNKFLRNKDHINRLRDEKFYLDSNYIKSTELAAESKYTIDDYNEMFGTRSVEFAITSSSSDTYDNNYENNLMDKDNQSFESYSGNISNYSASNASSLSLLTSVFKKPEDNSSVGTLDYIDNYIDNKSHQLSPTNSINAYDIDDSDYEDHDHFDGNHHHYHHQKITNKKGISVNNNPSNHNHMNLAHGISKHGVISNGDTHT